MPKNKTLRMIAMLLVVIGALNWGLVAFDFNLVDFLVGQWVIVEKTVYVLIALAGLYLAVDYFMEK